MLDKIPASCGVHPLLILKCGAIAYSTNESSIFVAFIRSFPIQIPATYNTTTVLLKLSTLSLDVFAVCKYYIILGPHCIKLLYKCTSRRST